jgi:hypothetical protein
MSSIQVVGVSLVVALFVAVVWHLWRRRLAWTAFAARHGWAVTDSGLQRLALRGRHHGRAVSVWMEMKPNSDDPNRTVVRLDVSDVLPRGLTLRNDELREGLLVWLGIRDDELGNDAVARVLDLHRITPQAIARFRAPSVREHLLGIRDHYEYCSLADGMLQLEQLKVPGTVDELEVFLGPSLDLGEALNATSPRPAERARG